MKFLFFFFVYGVSGKESLSGGHKPPESSQAQGAYAPRSVVVLYLTVNSRHPQGSAGPALHCASRLNVKGKENGPKNFRVSDYSLLAISREDTYSVQPRNAP